MVVRNIILTVLSFARAKHSPPLVLPVLKAFFIFTIVAAVVQYRKHPARVSA